MLIGVLGPPLFKEWDVELVCLDPSGFSNHGAKETILVLSLLPPQCSLLTSSWDAASDGLININVFNAVVILVVFDVESNCAERDSLSLEPPDTLKLEDSVCARIRQGLVL